MIRSLLASAALGAFLATGALAQDQAPASDPAAEPMAPAAPLDGAAPATAPALTGDWVVDEQFHPVDVASLTAEDIIDANIRSTSGEVVASVDDLVFGPDGKAESVAAAFGGFLGFGTNTVLLTLDEVEFMQDDSGTVALRTSVTPESLDGRPAYEG